MSDTSATPSSSDPGAEPRREADSVPAVEEIPAVRETYLDEDVVVRFKNP